MYICYFTISVIAVGNTTVEDKAHQYCIIPLLHTRKEMMVSLPIFNYKDRNSTM